MEDPVQLLQDILQPQPDLGNNAQGIPLPPMSGQVERCWLVPSRLSALTSGSGPFLGLQQHLSRSSSSTCISIHRLLLPISVGRGCSPSLLLGTKPIAIN